MLKVSPFHPSASLLCEKCIFIQLIVVHTKLGSPPGEHRGTTPKPDPIPANGGGDARSDLMAEIQKGKYTAST